jgi:hypothetical protein
MILDSITNFDYDALEIGRRLDAGAQGDVYEAELDEQDVVIKQFKNGTPGNVELLARLQHKNIVKLLLVSKIYLSYNGF